MRTSKFTDNHIMAVLKQNAAEIAFLFWAENTASAAPLFYKWHAKYGGIDTTMIKRLMELDDGNRRLKKMYAEECLKSQICQEALRESGKAISA